MVCQPRQPLRVLLGGMTSWRADVLSELLGPGEALRIVGLANDAHELIAAAAALSPDVVLLSLGDPAANALETTRRLCATSPGIRVVVLGDEEEEVYQIAAHAAGASAYLPWLAPQPVLLSTVWGANEARTSTTEQLRSV